MCQGIQMQQRLESCHMELRACTAAEAGNYGLAIQLFQEAVESCPGKAALHEQLAQCLLEAGNAESALEAAQRAVDCDAQVGSFHGQQMTHMSTSD